MKRKCLNHFIISRCKYSFDLSEFDHVSAAAKDLISRLLRRRPASRLTASQCLDHEWLGRDTMEDKTNRIKVA